ncbi:hypothetical protein BSL78_26718 [Apostichopus japonicus]|uniref:Guanylate kinase-like domain-containing protein n=1 Tax=Stichopus japonicus TaxID=307972 RepID=A0A2G8JL26_STIJA|nr:hypothetical protein BSL78_26718 [Apostichopus japonicus]
MPFLVELDASHNEISKLLDFSPPQNLQEVDMSFNLIDEMGDLSAHHALTKLVLDKNYLSHISGIESCVALQHLSLAHNNIKKIQNIENLSLKYLNLRGNQVEKVENLSSLKYLQHLDLSGNNISSLQGVEGNRVMEILDFENNQIGDIAEIEHIKDLRLLRSLNLLRNPIQDTADYRLSLLFRLPQLSELDRHRAEAEEKVSAVNLFSPPPEVIAAHDHRRCMVYSTLRAAKVHMSTLPNIETPYPILVLSGPLGAGKRVLAHRLVEEFGKYFGLGISHTTRSPLPAEMEGKDYKFVSPDDFDGILRKGDFLLTYQTSGHSYGVSLNAIETVAEQGLACVLPMEVEGVLSLKLAYFQPRYILLLPLDPKRQEERLQADGGLTSSQITYAVARTQLYQQTHQDKPGFFDRAIDTSDLENAYSQLSRLVMTYLGMESSGTESSGAELGDRSTPASRSSSHVESGSLPQSGSQRQGASSASSSVRTWSKPSGNPTLKQSSPGCKIRERDPQDK